jgi:NitT/TauT family transport system ATP-binding protein
MERKAKCGAPLGLRQKGPRIAQLLPWRTPLGNVTFGLEMKGVGKAEREAIALEQLKLVKLEKFVRSYPHHLSGGMQRRVAIARAGRIERDLPAANRIPAGIGRSPA